MAQQIEEATIPLKSDSDVSLLCNLLTGASLLISLIIAIASFPDGNMAILLFMTFAVAFFFLAKIAKRLEREDILVLHPKYFIDHAILDPQRKVHWDQVTSIRWHGTSSSDPCLTIKTEEFETPLGFFVVRLSEMNYEDRLTFIKYVRSSATDIQQERWESYCSKVAVPLIKVVENRKQEEQSENQPQVSRETVINRFSKIMMKHPVAIGFVLPIFATFLFSQLFPRKLFWTVAGLILVSGAINIRLVWGAWTEPFTSIVFWGSSILFILGLFSGGNNATADRKEQEIVIEFQIVFAYLIFVLVGIPFLLCALEKGWLPRDSSPYLGWCSIALILSPVIYCLLKSEDPDSKYHHQDATSYWQDWEKTN